MHSLIYYYVICECDSVCFSLKCVLFNLSPTFSSSYGGSCSTQTHYYVLIVTHPPPHSPSSYFLLILIAYHSYYFLVSMNIDLLKMFLSCQQLISWVIVFVQATEFLVPTFPEIIYKFCLSVIIIIVSAFLHFLINKNNLKIIISYMIWLLRFT